MLAIATFHSSTDLIPSIDNVIKTQLCSLSGEGDTSEEFLLVVQCSSHLRKVYAPFSFVSEPVITIGNMPAVHGWDLTHNDSRRPVCAVCSVL